jgi:hypothetical protein
VASSPTTRVEQHTDDARRQTARDARYEAQRGLWKRSGLPRVAYCGRFLNGRADGVVRVQVTGTPGTPDARAGFGGLQTCGSVWSCPVCSEKVNAARQSELADGMARWRERGGSVLFATFTMRHDKSMRLAPMWDALAGSWRKVIGSTAWRGGKRQIGDKARFGIEGFVRLVEVKEGAHGWHPHLHILLFTKSELSDSEIEDLRGRLHSRWESALEKDGYSTLEFDRDGHAVGTDLRRVVDGEYVAEYFAKNGYHPNATAESGAAYEVTGSSSKKRGKGGRTPFQLLADLTDDAWGQVDHETGELLGEHQDARTWREWETASRGRRQLTWSRGLRELLLPRAEELTDEEIAEQDFGGSTMSVIGGIFTLSGPLSDPGGTFAPWTC